MAKKEEQVVEEVQPTEEVKTPKSEIKEEGGDMKVKAPKFPKQFVNDKEDEPIKVDLTKKPEQEVEDNDTAKVDLTNKEEPVQEPVQEEKTEEQPEEQPIIEEIIEEEPVLKSEQEVKEVVEKQVEKLQDKVVEALDDNEKTGENLPENIQKVVDFMNDTGGSLEDYVKLNQDFSNYDDNSLLREYFKQTKPHLSDDEVSFVMEDLYSWDDEADDERDVRRKKLALKEQVANAKTHLDGLKSKYYEEIKAGVKLTPDQKKAVDFFNRYNEESESNLKLAQEQRDVFTSKTKELFDTEFKGFEYNVGDKKYRYNVKDAGKVKDAQSNLNNFVNKFLDKKQQLIDPKGYHKALFTANNPDAIANHFYQQGKADAMKDSMAKAKNVDMSPNQQHPNSVEYGGTKYKVISGDDSSKLRVKINKIN